MRYRVWVTGYPDSYVLVEADTPAGAMTIGGRTQRASHHGEIIEINARGGNPAVTRSRFVRLGRYAS